MPQRVRFAEFEFEPASGLLVRTAPDGAEVATRLSPQPAHLLQLLLEHAPEIVAHETIQQALWPGVQVDFERSLHFCVRQIRQALGEAATAPRFIGTVARRGYQWLTPVEAVDAPPRELAGVTLSPNMLDSSQPAAASSRWLAPLLLLLIALACGLAYFAPPGQASQATEASRPAPALRLAIMTFEPGPNAFAGADVTAPAGARANNGIAETLVDTLTRESESRWEVIGPTSTQAFATDDSLQPLIKEFRIDYLLNGRFILRAGAPRLLGEVIRATDGAHVWTQLFAPEASETDIAAAMLAGWRETATKLGETHQRGERP